MSKILYVKSTPKNEQNSWTLKMSEHFIRQYQRRYPDNQVTELDLYREQIDYLSQDDLESMMQPEKGAFANYVDQFLEHDKYVFAVPFWNLSFPAIFKAYLDRIIVVNKTFRYDENGIAPIVTGKKALFFMARGEAPSPEDDFAWRYWRSINRAFLGLDTTAFFFDGDGVISEEALQQQLQYKLEQITQIIDQF